MNHGYSPKDNNLNGKDLLMPYSATLYKKLLDKINTTGLNILDIGCGRGGGANVFAKYYNFAEIHGCDINDLNLNYCKSYSKDIEFKNSNSQDLDYKDNYFDIITNVESFHCYENKVKFLKEVSRVLKPNGLFLITDVIDSNVKYESYFLNNNLKLILDIDITNNVKDACFHAWNEFKGIEESEAKRWFINLFRMKYETYLSGKAKYKLLKFENIKN
jgi:O-methyltransferase